MSTERTPFVTDEQIIARAITAKNQFDLASGIRALYEAELARKDAEIEALRGRLPAEPEQRKECPNQVNGSCTLHNLFCAYPSCTYVKP